MDRLHLRDVRCFRGEHDAPIAPLTILVGENSTGKSTFLALTRIAWDLAYGAIEPDFNEAPFQLGSFNEIAHYHGGQGKRVRSFTVGFSESRTERNAPAGAEAEITLRGTFESTAGQPSTARVTLTSGRWALEADTAEDHLELKMAGPSGQYSLTTREGLFLRPLSVPTLSLLMERLQFRARGLDHEELFTGQPPSHSEIEGFMRAFRLGPRHLRSRRSLDRPLAMAPVRTRPQRTYDPLKEVRSPEGEHVPMLLARLYATELGKWRSLAEGLALFGKESGLFTNVIVRRFAGSESTPFQIKVTLAGQKKEVNLVDVGYGVSQILPVVVDALVERRPATFLMQQPEVHLHPRAQAALASFLVPLIHRRKHRFLLETHSDHIIDRVRVLVKEGRLAPGRVRILFFDRSGPQVRIFPLSLDSEGNLRGTPPGYRDFFLEEELRLISP